MFFAHIQMIYFSLSQERQTNFENEIIWKMRKNLFVISFGQSIHENFSFPIFQRTTFPPFSTLRTGEKHIYGGKVVSKVLYFIGKTSKLVFIILNGNKQLTKFDATSNYNGNVKTFYKFRVPSHQEIIYPI